MEDKKRYPEYNRVTDTEVFFYTPRFYPFDNLSAFSVNLWGKTFMTSEHAYQWKKFSASHPDIAEEIFNSTSAYMTKKISDAHAGDVIPEWHQQKAEVMEEILRAKLAQHEKVKKLLIESGTREIIENSPADTFWGIADGSGENRMGKLWMKLRDELK